MQTLTKEQIKEIADMIDTGSKAYWNRNTGELLFIPDEMDIYMWDEEESDLYKEELNKLEKDPENYLEIERMSSFESFRVMEDFADQLDVKNPLKHRLFAALSKKKPFREFKFVIDNSGDYRQLWFDFKSERQQEWIEKQVRDADWDEDDE